MQKVAETSSHNNANCHPLTAQTATQELVAKVAALRANGSRLAEIQSAVEELKEFVDTLKKVSDDWRAKIED